MRMRRYLREIWCYTNGYGLGMYSGWIITKAYYHHNPQALEI